MILVAACLLIVIGYRCNALSDIDIPTEVVPTEPGEEVLQEDICAVADAGWQYNVGNNKHTIPKSQITIRFVACLVETSETGDTLMIR